ncbi:hypothetical protein CR513_56514, partial [Mucuna pruriens]
MTTIQPSLHIAIFEAIDLSIGQSWWLQKVKTKIYNFAFLGSTQLDHPPYFTLRSSRIIFIHNPSYISCVMARNYDSTLDQATTFCFLLLQFTRFPPKNIQYPVVNLLSTIHKIKYILPLGDKDTLFVIYNLYPKEAQSHELKFGLIHLLPKFHGLASEDPHKFLKEFHGARNLISNLV